MDGLDQTEREMFAFWKARLDEAEKRAGVGYYSDTHWERFTTEAHLGAWQAWRQYFPREQWDVKANDVISEAARDSIRARITAHEADRTRDAHAAIAAARQRFTALEEAIGAGHDSYDLGAALLPLELLPYANHPDYKEAWRP